MSGDALAGLDEQQRVAASLLRGPVCVLAGAGTGKTRVITHRIAHGVDTGAYSPGRVMAVTFTAKAAGEMRGRLRALGVAGVAARTFHATALAQLNFFWPQLAGDTAPSIIDRLPSPASLGSSVLGAIAGDIIGSTHEWARTKTKDFPLFAVGSTFTDDTVMTVAVAQCLLDGLDYVDAFHRYFDTFPNAGYGGMFLRWAARKRREPGSW